MGRWSRPSLHTLWGETGWALSSAQKDGIQTGLSPRDLEPADERLERSLKCLVHSSVPLFNLWEVWNKELLMGLTPCPYITQSPGVWSPQPHSQLQFHWSQQAWGAGTFFLLKHCSWWWNYTKALEQVSWQRWNSNLWHFEHSLVFLPRCYWPHLGAAI